MRKLEQEVQFVKEEEEVEQAGYLAMQSSLYIPKV